MLLIRKFIPAHSILLLGGLCSLSWSTLQLIIRPGHNALSFLRRHFAVQTQTLSFTSCVDSKGG